MEEIFKLVHNCSIQNKIIGLKEIEKILEIIVNYKELNNYVLDIGVKNSCSNNLASYCEYNKKITIYMNVIYDLFTTIGNSIKIKNELLVNLYKNLRLLQIIFHEIEHANQLKIVLDNTLEAFILKISELVYVDKRIYEFTPSERFAEIKSFSDVSNISNFFDNKYLLQLLKCDQLQRTAMGYHVINSNVVSPLISYFKNGDMDKALRLFEWYSECGKYDFTKLNSLFSLEERLYYGFPISNSDYYDIMHELINKINLYYANRIKCKCNKKW